MREGQVDSSRSRHSLDGEVCIFERQLVSRFEWLWHGKPHDAATPPVLFTACTPPTAIELRV